MPPAVILERPEPFFFEGIPFDDPGGIGPIEYGPWAVEAARTRTLKKMQANGRVVSAQEIGGSFGILEWEPGRYNAEYLSQPFDLAVDRDLAMHKFRDALEQELGRPVRLRRFKGLSRSLYQHRHPKVRLAEINLRFSFPDEWLGRAPKFGLAPAAWARGTRAVGHWQGPGAPAIGYRNARAQHRGFAAHHMDTNGWSFYAYSFGIPQPLPSEEPGLIFVGRGWNRRTAATGNNVGNGLPSIILPAGVLKPVPDADALETLLALREREGWGVLEPHWRYNSTSCPGPSITGLLEQANRNLALAA